MRFLGGESSLAGRGLRLCLPVDPMRKLPEPRFGRGCLSQSPTDRMLTRLSMPRRSASLPAVRLSGERVCLPTWRIQPERVQAFCRPRCWVRWHTWMARSSALCASLPGFAYPCWYDSTGQQAGCTRRRIRACTYWLWPLGRPLQPGFAMLRIFKVSIGQKCSIITVVQAGACGNLLMKHCNACPGEAPGLPLLC